MKRSLPHTVAAHCPTHQAFDDLQQLLHHHGDALVAQQSAHDLDVRGTHKVPVGAKYAAVRQVQGLHSEERQVMMKEKCSQNTYFNTRINIACFYRP